MQHQFRTPEGPVEVTVAKQGDVWHLGEHRATVEPDGRLRIQLASGGSALATVAKVDDTWWIHFEGHTFCLERIEPGASQSGEEGGLTAPMPGKVLDVLVQVGQIVEAGQTLMILEAMKMEHRILASTSGHITGIHFTAGEQVQQGSVLLEMTEDED
ncbi:MAG: biotin/lipoyl-binding protein [Euryarchaeota archaeon]|nr:biotin/lipoyl-binding protein [Euryarchaeota archaeon]